MEDKYIDKVREQHRHLFNPVLTPEEIAKMDKRDVIDTICKHHPAEGTEKGYSWYIGGMADSGEWIPMKMHYMTIGKEQELYEFLIELEKAKYKSNEWNIQNLAENYRRKDLPKEESDKLYKEDQQKQIDTLAQITKDREMHLMWGK